MISKVYSGTIPPDKLIGEHVIVVFAVYALVIFAGIRGWLRGKELPWVGAALIFWAIAWLLEPTLGVVRGHFPALSKSLPMSIGLIAPIIVAMGFGLYFTAKRAAAKQSATKAG